MKENNLNSDLICCNFTELTDDEFYETLLWANTTLMANYFDKQKISTLSQINHLYTSKDTTFRGFRHNAGSGQTGFKFNKKGQKVVSIDKNKPKKLTNWENSFSDDGERFTQKTHEESGEKSMEMFHSYMRAKEAREIRKSEERRIRQQN